MRDEVKASEKEDWRRCYWFETPPGREFYDFKNDPLEMDNRYNDPQYADIIVYLKKQLRETRERLNETDESYPKIQAVVEEHWDD